jgi:hypothetical protein
LISGRNEIWLMMDLANISIGLMMNENSSIPTAMKPIQVS